jgi:fructose/tagatose bisphosphate aldolase
MTLVRSTEILAYAQKTRFAVGAFNADNMEMLRAIVEATSLRLRDDRAVAL